jgi:hypothetical protein
MRLNSAAFDDISNNAVLFALLVAMTEKPDRNSRAGLHSFAIRLHTLVQRGEVDLIQSIEPVAAEPCWVREQEIRHGLDHRRG